MPTNEILSQKLLEAIKEEKIAFEKVQNYVNNCNYNAYKQKALKSKWQKSIMLVDSLKKKLRLPVYNIVKN